MIESCNIVYYTQLYLKSCQKYVSNILIISVERYYTIKNMSFVVISKNHTPSGVETMSQLKLYLPIALQSRIHS